MSLYFTLSEENQRPRPAVVRSKNMSSIGRTKRMPKLIVMFRKGRRIKKKTIITRVSTELVTKAAKGIIMRGK